MTQTVLQIQNVTFDDLKNLIANSVKESLQGTANEPTKVNHLLTRKEAAKILKISLVTLNDWSKKGFIQPYKIGGQIRYKQQEVESSVERVKTLKYRRAV